MYAASPLLCTFSLATVVAASYAANLFPIPVEASWTTSRSTSGLPANVNQIDLSDQGVNLTKQAGGLPHDLVPAPGAGVAGNAWRASYPKGSYNPSGEPKGGFGFYFAGPSDIWAGADQILFSYAVYFPGDFQFNMGGKLPGPYGGEDQEIAFGCTGGRQADRDKCFDLRLMWRTNGAGEIYAYVPETDGNKEAGKELEGTVIDSSYGMSLARGAFNFTPGDWTVVAERVRLNTPGQTDGEIELWVDGKSVIHATGLAIRSSASSTFRGVHCQTFFGGSTADWASPVDQFAYFAEMSGAVLAAGASPADGKAAFPLASNDTTKGQTSGGTSPISSQGGTEDGTGTALAVSPSIATSMTLAVLLLTFSQS
ncbi:hypothetical protein AURDEDRAFT_74614 [Auricularia subglabra TFB-10046 SS5]|nr:hypothetical protein AURDEDRAFT_74614 [Auricularia subglabra TFB-10046 SS5]